MSSKHTPGPWEVFVSDDGGRWSGWPISILATSVENLGGDHRTVVRTGGFYPYEWDQGTSRDEANANARLIAAAPDLLAALNETLRQYVELAISGDCGDWDPWIEQHVINARAAIAKATGGVND